MSSEKAQRVAKLLELSLAPSQVRAYIDKFWVNKDNTNSFNEWRKQLVAIKKAGCPMEVPKAPDHYNFRTATAAERLKHKELREEFEEALKEYNKYASPEYLKLTVVHQYYRNLARLASILTRKDLLPPGAKKEVAELQQHLLNSNEKSDFASVRSKSFVAAVEDVDLTESEDSVKVAVAAIKAELTRLTVEYKGLDLFIKKDEVSHNKLRFNGTTSVVMATIIQAFISQYAAAAIKTACSSDLKTVKPEHGLDNENLSLFTLIANAPHYLAVKNRRDRRLEFEETRAAKKAQLIREAKLKARREETKYKAVKFEKVTFEEEEVELNYAVARQVPVKVKEGEEPRTKTKYFWYDIEEERTEQSMNFEGAVDKIARSALDDAIFAGTDGAENLRIGSSFVVHLDGLVRDIIARVTMAALQFTDRTLTENTISSIFRVILMDSYAQKTPSTTLNPDHTNIFNLVEHKVAKYNKYKEDKKKDKAHKVEKAEPISPDQADDDLEDDVPATKSTTKTVAELKAANGLNGSSKKKVNV